MDYSRFEQLLNEIFVTNMTSCNVNPLNAKPIKEERWATALKEKEVEKEIYDSLVDVVALIDEHGGIQEAVYEANKYAINSLARDLTGQRWWGSVLTYYCVEEDRKGEKATPEQIARFPEDGRYKRNILGDGKEGTLFQIEYDPKGNMSLFRIFHQGHRSRLSRKTCSIDALIEKIKDYVANFQEEPEPIEFGLQLTEDEYRAKIKEFNSKFGDYVMMRVFGKGKDTRVYVEVEENPEEFANILVRVGDLSSNPNLKGGRTGIDNFPYVSISDTNLDIYPERSAKDSFDAKPFDPIREKYSHSFIRPDIKPDLSIPLLIEYLKYKTTSS